MRVRRSLWRRGDGASLFYDNNAPTCSGGASAQMSRPITCADRSGNENCRRYRIPFLHVDGIFFVILIVAHGIHSEKMGEPKISDCLPHPSRKILVLRSATPRWVGAEMARDGILRPRRPMLFVDRGGRRSSNGRGSHSPWRRARRRSARGRPRPSLLQTTTRRYRRRRCRCRGSKGRRVRRRGTRATRRTEMEDISTRSPRSSLLRASPERRAPRAR